MTPPEPPHQRARYWRVPRRRRGWMAVIGWTVWALVGLTVSVLAGGYIYLDDTLEQAAPNTPEARKARAATKPVLPGQPTNILLIGSDTRPSEGDPGRSDSLILVRMDPQRDFISMLSFPRDLYVPIPGYGTDKINAAYSYGTDVTIETVEQLTGQPINHYVIIDFTGFEKLVDAVGGVYLDIDRRYFNENVGTAATNYANIDLQPGYQRLNGSDALAYVRYRHTDSTYSRDARQQTFLSELKRQTKDLGNLTNVTNFRKIFGENIEFSIRDPQKFISLLELALVTPKDRIARVSIDAGSDMTAAGASIQVASQGAIDEAVAAWREPEFEFGQKEAVKPIAPESVDVVVQNGSGRLLAAEDVAEALATKKYRTSVGGNADSFDYASSAVYYAPAFREPARKIAALLGPGATIGALAGSAKAGGNEVVVIAGADFTGELAPPPPKETAPAATTVDTTSLVEPLREARKQVPGLPVMAPLKVASNSSVRIIRPYSINRSDSGGPPAIKIVFEHDYHEYWGISMTTMKNPPILQGETGSYTSGGRKYLTFYDGKNLQRLAFQSGGVTYWVSNTLNNDLSAKTIEEIAKSMRPLNRATLKKGRTDTAITVETEGSTP
ncbi:MAG: LCP family protein [Thermoleophilia bacterium]|nr:LCP family protein [Thermoleophilia bacterium]